MCLKIQAVRRCVSKAKTLAFGQVFETVPPVAAVHQLADDVGIQR
jgi:hypothetical protein